MGYLRVALVGLLGLLFGVLTAYGQGWLPEQVGSVANSSGSWALLAFLLALAATSRPMAAALGCLTLITLLAGYVLGAGIRGDTSSRALLVLWGLAAVLVGPLLGLGAYWVKSGRGVLAGLGTGGMGGVLVGEGVYGLTTIADTTSPPYWWGEIVLGVVLLVWVGWRRLDRPKPVALAAVSSLVVAAGFVGLYRQG